MKQLRLLAMSIAIMAALGFVLFKSIETKVTPVVQTNTPSITRCDADAKLCPDGTTVLRVGEQCEFAACPSMYGDEKDWRSAKDPNTDISFKYPETFGNDYVRTSAWPPAFTVSDDPFSCDSTSNSTPNKEIINGTAYCTSEEMVEAAGSTYTTYRVTFVKEEKTVAMSFTIQSVQCITYEGTQQSACQAAQASFKIQELTDTIANSVRL
jgi:hypothetical protein